MALERGGWAAIIVPMRTFPRGTLDPWYVTGFAEGGGTFTYSRSSGNIGLYFAIRLTEADAPVLGEIQVFFGGAGRIYDQKPRAIGRSSGQSKAASYYRVTRCRDLLRVVSHFEKYPLQGTKRNSFEIWREMVAIKNEHYRRPPSERLEELAQRLTQA